MNEAEKANQESDVFLKQVRLKNYKSIIDAEIDFKPGLNIIIGNNGSGKTNFLNYTYDVLSLEWDNKSELDAKFTIKNENNLYKFLVEKKRDVEVLPNKSLDEILNRKNKATFKVLINNSLQEESEANSANFLLGNNKVLDYNLKFVHHGIPIEQDIVERPVQLLFTFNSLDDTSVGIQTKFIESVISKLAYSVFFNEQQFDVSKVQASIEELDIFFNNLQQALKAHTDIKDLRISSNFNLYPNKDKKKIDVHNLFLEFYLNQVWIPYSSLSDGSKRLFYVISEILSYRTTEIIIGAFNSQNLNELPSPKEIILLEEPELGIHPHQLHKLMLFIKEQSKTKQIILTTHSPQVLNILDADELDRIIICNYDQKKGTQLKHLTEKQIKKGQMYMQNEGFLSDYWVHSDLEPAD